MRANVLTTTSPRPSPPGEGVDSPAAKRHPLKRGKGLIRLIIIRHYESDEDLGVGFDGGSDAAGGMPTGEGRTDEECAC